jgi:hypothetical protein
MKKYLVIFCLFALGMTLPAYDGQAQAVQSAAQTRTPLPTRTPTHTRTPIPSRTPRPTKTLTPKPTLALNKYTVVKRGGFAFQYQPPAGYEMTVRDAQVDILDKTGAVAISLMGVTSTSDVESPEAMMGITLASFAKPNGEGAEILKSYFITIDGVKGLAVDFVGALGGMSVQGQVVIAVIARNQYLFGLGFGMTSSDTNRWTGEGLRIFTALINSIRFMPPDRVATPGGGTCKIATDDTYGYTQENPIKVGGGALGGPPREEAYLDNLLGPNGEKLTYQRHGSFSFGGTILDIYEISGLKEPVTLYVDEYTFTEPQAPVGFTCQGAFPLD